MIRSTWSVLGILGLSLGLIGPVPSAVADDLKVGDKAPAFSLPGTDGKTYSLADFNGKKAVVMAWYPKAFTGGCTAECKSIRENSESLKPLNVAYFTASVDTPELNKKFAEALMLDYPILSDPSTEVARAYGVFSPERKIALRWTFYIDKDGTVKEIDKGVQTRTKTAGADLAAKIKELGLEGK